MVRSRGTPLGGSPTGKRVASSSRWRLGGALLSAGLSAVSGCNSDGLKPPDPIDRSKLYWALELNHHAVVLEPPGEGALYDTLTLVATPHTIDGTPLSGLPAPTYISGNPEKVTVTSDGVLRAIAPTNQGEIVPVVATLTAGNLKHIDTVLVTVLDVDPRPVLASLSIQPIPNTAGYADSAKVGAGTGIPTTCFALPTWTATTGDCRILLPVTALDASGDTIPGVPVAFQSSDERAALVKSGIDQDQPGKIFLGSRPPAGQVTFYASTTVFGVTRADTLPFRIGWPVLALNHVSRTSFSFPVLKVGVGAVVAWDSDVPFNIDIGFTDPTHVASVGQPPPSFLTAGTVFIFCQFNALCGDAGNAVMVPNPRLGGVSVALRRFPVPGTYDYSSTALGGISGRIIVLDER